MSKKRFELLSEAAQTVSKRPDVPLVERSTAAAFSTRTVRARQGRRDHRLSRYETVMEQVRDGLSQAEISRLLGIDRRTIRRWTQSGDFPERKPVFRKSSLDDHRRYLEQRWEEELSELEGVLFCPGVCNRTDMEPVPIRDAAELVDFEVLYTRTDWSDPAVYARRQAAERCEILVPKKVPFRYFSEYFPHG